MTHRSPSLLIGSVACLFMCAGSLAQTQYPAVIHQTLVSGSTYTSQGCLEPCACLVYEPPYSGALAGEFTLRYSHADQWTVYYNVTDVSLHTGTVLEPALHYTGTGTYEYGGDFALTQRLVLALTADTEGAVEQVFDSGHLVVTGSSFPQISLRLQTDIVDCSKRWMDVSTAAEPIQCTADLGGAGGAPQPDGVLNNNDFVVFIDYFFAGDALADLGSQGGAAGADGAFDNNDFVVFVDAFFAGC